MTEQTAPWIWPDTYSDLKTICISKKDIAYIKKLAVGWSVAELGAPELLQSDGERLYDEIEENDNYRLANLLNLFLHHAQLPKTARTIHNPFISDVSAEVKDEALYGLPDKATAKQLQEHPEIHLQIDDTLQQLWDSCDLRPYGFDPKRGFTLSNLKAIADPEGKLSKSELSKLKKHYKGQLFLYLQLFVQQAELSIGDYHSFDDITWIAGTDYAIADERTAHEWFTGFNSDYFKATDSFIDVMNALPNLSKRLCADGAKSYADIVGIFNLDKLYQYDADNTHRAQIDLLEIINKAIKYFPYKHDNEQEGYSFVQLAVRIYNAQGEFAKAQQLLQAHNLDLFNENQLEFFVQKPNKYRQLAFYESCICQMALTGDYELWRFPDFPKFTEAEFAKYDIPKGFIQRNSPEYQDYLQKLAEVEKARAMTFDFRQYLDYEYFNNFDLIFKNLEEKGIRDTLDELIVAVVGQINVMQTLSIYK